MPLINYSLFPASFVHAGGTLNLAQLRMQGVQPNSEKDVIIPGGALDAGAVIESHAQPIVRVGTRDLTALLAVLSLTTGLKCTGNCIFRWQKRVAQSTFATGASHTTLTATSGFLNCESIRAAQNDVEGAMADLSFFPLFDGTNKPLAAAITADFDLATQPAFNSAFFLGPVYLGAAQIEGIQSVEITPGISFRPVSADGDLYARVGVIDQRRPRLKFTLTNVSYVSTITSLFGNAFASAIACYFAKGVSGGGRVSSASTVHCKVSAAAGDWTPDDISVEGNGDGSLAVVVTPTGSLSYSIASTIP